MKPLKAMAFVGAAIGLLVAAVPSLALVPANPNADRDVRAILNYLDGLEHRTDRMVVSGQFTDVRPDGSMPDLQKLFDVSGRWPAITGFDYVIGHSGKAGFDWHGVNEAAIKVWKAGGLVTISAHVDDPARPGGGGLRDKPIDMNLLLTPGETRDRWFKQLDALADGLQDLKDHGVVVLWRPFHEMNGNWFWWGGGDPAALQKVWRQMFDYFTKTKKLDNLIWVYSPNHGKNTAAYYAGDHYVDLVGLDAYTDFLDQGHIKGYDEVAALPKPFGFTEFGPHGPENPPGDFDERRLIEGLLKNFPRAVFFMSWNWRWSIGMNQHGKDLMESPSIITRKDLPRSLFAATPR